MMMHLMLVSSLLALLSALVLASPLPTNFDGRQSIHDGSSALCSGIKCEEGSANLSNVTGHCVCPQWANENPVKPCGFVQCPNTTEVHYSSTTNQCICRVNNVTPVLIHQATEIIAQQNASVYSVKPYFLDGVISFLVALAGSPTSFNLNASTTITASSIGTDPEPNLVIVPKNMKTRIAKSAEETALIIAITFDSDDTIAYHVRLNNGTVVKLYGDKYVHDIDLIDPTAPPSLSILSSHTFSHLKRDVGHTNEEAMSPMRPEPVTMAKRGVEGLSAYTATFSEDSCSTIKCRNNGGKPAMFNRFLNSCECQTLVTPENGFTKRRQGIESEMGENLPRGETDNSLLRPPFDFGKPSLETCRRIAACHGESQPYFDEGTKQCLCIIYRAGVKEPVIVSDGTVLPRAG